MGLYVDFFGTQVSRMILGDNPVNGHSYVPEVYDGEEMKDFYTAETVIKTFREAEAMGINTCLPLANDYMLRILRQYRNEGGQMNVIFQPYPAIDLKINLRMMMAAKPIGIYHQGTTTDFLCEKKDYQTIRDNIQMIRDAGVAVGMATHEPEIVIKAEEEDWGVDFYMTSLYNARTGRHGEASGFLTGKSKHLLFNLDDRYKMFDVIQKVSKPCIAFKIFAGGQVFYHQNAEETKATARKLIQEIYDQIKPTDIACMGVYQKYKDQIKENMAIVRDVLGD